jgi:iron complex transport system ATP-binding protein
MIAVENVHYRVNGDQGILHGISLTVRQGERLAIVGPNGAGKTTLLRLLFARARPSAGRVLIEGRDLSSLPADERARLIAVVGQGDQPDGRLSVLDYVALGRIPHRGRGTATKDAAAAREACERVGLSRFLDRKLDSLSGGERQRAGIARALAQNPAVLLLDEPTNHLDPRARVDLLALVRGLGITIVAVLHDLTLVPGFADRVAVLKDGGLVALGPPEEALSAATVRGVFAMDCFQVANPLTGRSLFVFDRPCDASLKQRISP